jgi:acyl-homoserine lactone acylase PvdQ
MRVRLSGTSNAQAEDNFWQIEDSYIQALGRASRSTEKRSLEADLLNRPLGIAELSRNEYPRRECGDAGVV